MWKHYIKIRKWGFRPHQGIILFNAFANARKLQEKEQRFRPHQGIILFNPVFETTDIY